MIPTRWSSAFAILRRRLQQVEADQRLLREHLSERARDACKREDEAAGDEPVARPAHRHWLDIAESEPVESEPVESEPVEPGRPDSCALACKTQRIVGVHVVP